MVNGGTWYQNETSTYGTCTERRDFMRRKDYRERRRCSEGSRDYIGGRSDYRRVTSRVNNSLTFGYM